MRRAFVLMSLLIGAQTFHVLQKTNSKNHQDITRSAILHTTAKVCFCSTDIEGFINPDLLNTEKLARSCKKDAFTENFETGIKMISYYNVMTVVSHALETKYHFDNEKFTDGKKIIITGMGNIIDLIKKQKFDDARKTLGQILHVLQDFYSHSNWIELGYTKPCTALINPEENIPNPADEKQETCEKNRPNDNSGAKILQNIIDKKILTSGYFSMTKPKGKCSHGGTFDLTTGTGRSWDGINKDYSDSSHGYKHNDAVKVAIKASVQLLEKIWKSIDKEGGNNFLRLMGLHSETPKGEWKTHIPLIHFTMRYKDAAKDVEI